MEEVCGASSGRVGEFNHHYVISFNTANLELQTFNLGLYLFVLYTFLYSYIYIYIFLLYVNILVHLHILIFYIFVYFCNLYKALTCVCPMMK